MYSLVSLKLVFLPSFSWTHHNRSLINKRRSNAPEPSKSLNHEWIASHIAVSRREVTVWVETSHDCLPPFRKHPINKVILLLGLTTLLTNNRNVLPSSSWHRKNAPLRTFSYILLLIYKCLWVKTFVRVLGDSNLNLFGHLSLRSSKRSKSWAEASHNPLLFINVYLRMDHFYLLVLRVFINLWILHFFAIFKVEAAGFNYSKEILIGWLKIWKKKKKVV